MMAGNGFNAATTLITKRKVKAFSRCRQINQVKINKQMKRQDILSIRAGTSRMFYGIHPRQVSVARSMIQNIKMFGEMPPDVERYITSTGGKPGQLVITAVPAKDKVQYKDV